MTDYTPIEEYGLIGNLETCALVGQDGSIDWCPLPTLESSSTFSSILDVERGGHFSIRPVMPFESDQQYADRTNVLQTAFHTTSGTVTVTDFMPVFETGTHEEPEFRAIYRQITCTDGSVDLDIEFRPRFDYARADTTVETITDGVVATSDRERVFLSSPVDFRVDDGTARTTCSMSAHETEWFVFQYGAQAPTDHEECERLLAETVEYWRNWAHTCSGDGDCKFAGYGHELAVRSGLALKLLIYRDSGAIAAAPTTSLPEEIGGVRNWDYRYTWLRDSTFMVRALSALGHTREAKDYLNRFLHLSREFDPASIQPLYGLEHQTSLEEEELDHLSGYMNSRPVRVGNRAASQLQLDVYGELVLAAYQLSKSDEEIATEDWNAVRKIVEYVRNVWKREDAGIWELRRDPKHIVHSKVMCWVALDRAITIAEENDLDAPTDEWRETREEIHTTVCERGFNDDRNSFTQSFDDDTLDAACLAIPLHGFLPIDDPRVEGTIDAVLDRLLIGDGLVRRYEGGDDLPGEEGAFVLCSCWLVSCLALAGRLDEARGIYEAVTEHTSPLGLLSEEVDPDSGRLLGNYPQAFSHIGLVNSALHLKEAREDMAVQPFEDVV